jgi:hypothetical protein
MAMRGMDLISATTFLAEIGDLSRFQTPREPRLDIFKFKRPSSCHSNSVLVSGSRVIGTIRV